MGWVLRRTARSTNVKERADFSCALFDRDLRTVAQAFAMPMHLSSMALAVRQAIGDSGRELHRGDSLAFNYVPLGGVHLNDIIVLSAVHLGDVLVGYVANIAHHVDVGGMTAGSIGLATEVFQEGVIIPPVLVERAGELDPEVLGIIKANVRGPDVMFGDLRAQLGANRVGAIRFREIAERWGLEHLQESIDELLDSTERETRRALAMLPDGVYEARGQVDDDGFTDVPIEIPVRIEKSGDRIRFDLTAADAQRPSPMGATYASAFSGCAYVLKCLLMPDTPVNEGFYRAIEVSTRPGTVLHVVHPGAIAGGGELCQTFVDTLIRAFADALPERVIASCKGCLGNIAFGGTDPRTGRFYAFYETIGGGFGARPNSDGMDAVQTHMSNAENAAIEVVETQHPVRITRYELIPDSAGLGKYRGGLGIRRDYFFDHPATFSILSDRARTGPRGLFGGGDAGPARYVLNPGSAGERRLPSKGTVNVEPGDTISIQTPGGGGYGPARERARELIDSDIRTGKVTQWHG
jgi:N-methylhydantoinase B